MGDGSQALRAVMQEIALAERARQSGHWPGDQPFTAATMQRLLAARIDGLDVTQARADIERFVADPQPLAIWSRAYFSQIGQRIITA